MGHIGAMLAHLGAILDHLGAMLNNLGAILTKISKNIDFPFVFSMFLSLQATPSWTYVGPSWGHVAPSWDHLGPSWDHLAPSLGPSCGHRDENLCFIDKSEKGENLPSEQTGK